MSAYSIKDLFELMLAERGEGIRLEVGCEPMLTIDGKPFEIEGPAMEEANLEEMLRAVAGSRDLRTFRQQGAIDVLHTHHQTQFLVRAVRACGVCRLDLCAVKATRPADER